MSEEAAPQGNSEQVVPASAAVPPVRVKRPYRRCGMGLPPKPSKSKVRETRLPTVKGAPGLPPLIPNAVKGNPLLGTYPAGQSLVRAEKLEAAFSILEGHEMEVKPKLRELRLTRCEMAAIVKDPRFIPYCYSALFLAFLGEFEMTKLQQWALGRLMSIAEPNRPNQVVISNTSKNTKVDIVMARDDVDMQEMQAAKLAYDAEMSKLSQDCNPIDAEVTQ